MTRVIVEIREQEDKSLQIKSFASPNVTTTGKEMDAAKKYIDRFDQLMREASARVVKKNPSRN